MENPDIEVKNTQKVDELNELSNKLRSRDLNEAIVISTEAIKLAKKLSYKEGLALSYFHRGTCYRHQFVNDLSLQDFNKAFEIYSELNNLRGQVKVYNSISHVYGNLGDNKKALEYLKTALGLAEEIDDNDLRDTIHSNIASVYIHQGDIPKALGYLLDRLKEHNKNGTEVSEKLLNNLAAAYYALGDKKKALKYFIQCAERTGKRHNIIARGHMLVNIGTIYSEMKKYDEGLNYINWGLKLLEDSGHKHGVVQALDAMSDIYLIKGIYEKALRIAAKSKFIKEEMNDKAGVVTSLHQIGDILLKQKDFAEAKSNFTKALDMAISLQDKTSQRLIYISYARLHLEINEFNEAIGLLDKALQLAEEENSVKDINDIYKLLYTAYRNNNEPSKALEYHEKLFDSTRELNKLEAKKN